MIYVFYSANSFVQNGYDRLNVTGGGMCRIPVKPSRPGHVALGDCHCVLSLVGVRKRQWILKGSERAGLSGREIPKTPASCCPASACLFLLLHPLQAPHSRQTRPSARCRPGGGGLLSMELPRAGRLLGPQSPGPAWLQNTARGTEAFTVAELGLSAHWRLEGPSPLFPRSSSHLSPLRPGSITSLRPRARPVPLPAHPAPTRTHVGCPVAALFPAYSRHSVFAE